MRDARSLLSNGRANGTVNRYLGALRSCWNWGRAAQFIPAEKVWPTRLLLTEPDARVRYLNDSELAAVLDKAKQCALWMHAGVVLSIATGLRQGEMLRLEWANVDLLKGTVTVMQAKNTKGRGNSSGASCICLRPRWMRSRSCVAVLLSVPSADPRGSS